MEDGLNPSDAGCYQQTLAVLNHDFSGYLSLHLSQVFNLKRSLLCMPCCVDSTFDLLNLVHATVMVPTGKSNAPLFSHREVVVESGLAVSNVH
jgi:hypothetical protein